MTLQGDEIFIVNDDGEVISKKPDGNDKDTPPSDNSNSDYEDLFTFDPGSDNTNEGEEQEEESDDKSTENKDNKPAPQEPSSSTLNLQALTIALRETGYLPNASEEDLKDLTSAEKFALLIEKEIRLNEYNDLPDDVAESLKALRNGASWSDIVSFKKQELQNSSYTEDDLKGDDDIKVENRKAVIRQLYKRTTQFNDTKIDNLIQRAIDTGSDEKDALESLKELQELDRTAIVEFNKQQEKLASEKAKQQQDKIKNIKETIEKTDEFIPGFKFNKVQKDSLYKSIVEPVGKTTGGVPINAFTKSFNDDESFRMKVHAISVLTKNFTDFSVFETKAKKNALKEFDKKNAESKANDSFRNNYSLEDDRADTSLIDFLNKSY